MFKQSYKSNITLLGASELFSFFWYYLFLAFIFKSKRDESLSNWSP